MWKGTIQGYVSSIGSDHSPGPAERKAGGWENIFRAPDGQAIPFGAPSIETLIPLMYSEGVMKRGLPLWWMARALGENPARIFGLYPRKGVIQPGSDADLLIFDPEAELTIKAADHKGTSGFTPYEGRPIKGKPWMTLLRGRILLKDGVLHQKAGSGKYIPAGPPMPPMSGNAA
jgi:dihydropyrimidinase